MVEHRVVWTGKGDRPCQPTGVPQALPDTCTQRIIVGGRVQGVGFRPYVYRLAQREGLTGWVRNLSGQVEIQAYGDRPALSRFLATLANDAPPSARPIVVSVAEVDGGAQARFAILESSSPATPACVTCSIPPTGGSATRSSTARNAGRVTR
jgi:acylphosphatase